LSVLVVWLGDVESSGGYSSRRTEIARQRQVPIRSLRDAVARTENIDLEAAGAVIVVRPG
jgi:hypothetical protein